MDTREESLIQVTVISPAAVTSGRSIFSLMVNGEDVCMIQSACCDFSPSTITL